MNRRGFFARVFGGFTLARLAPALLDLSSTAPDALMFDPKYYEVSISEYQTEIADDFFRVTPIMEYLRSGCIE